MTCIIWIVNLPKRGLINKISIKIKTFDATNKIRFLVASYNFKSVKKYFEFYELIYW